MRSTVRKWGNSLALRIPQALATALALEDATELDVTVRNGALVASPVSRWTLEALVAGINPGNTHADVAWGDLEGREL